MNMPVRRGRGGEEERGAAAEAGAGASMGVVEAEVRDSAVIVERASRKVRT
jgi:hypothetical protein